MVSTRAVKLKFLEGERVLCYEPDPTKAKVLYDSKVLQVVASKDHRGRKVLEYLIHFQGWNSSWDRCVGEEYVLKDTPENRQLQKDLAHKSQLQLGAYLYRRERKKHGRKTSERTVASSEDGSCGSPALIDDEDNQRPLSSSEDDSSVDDDLVPIELTHELREHLQHDYHIINIKQKLHKLPAEPNVVSILESYWKNYVNNQIGFLNEKPRYRNYSYHKICPEDIQTNINICREVLDGIRIYFDFTLQDLLLYKSELGQIQVSQANFLSLKSSCKEEIISAKVEVGDKEYAHIPIVEDDLFSNEMNDHNSHSTIRTTHRRSLRSNRSLDSNGTHIDSFNTKTSPGTINNINDITNYITKIPVWKVLPNQIYEQHPPPPCLIYGATHLTRLFVKLPELLNNTNMSDSNLKVLLRHLDSLIDYLNDHKDWYGEKCYIEE